MIDLNSIMGQKIDRLIENYGLDKTIKIMEDNSNLFITDDIRVAIMHSTVIKTLKHCRDTNTPVPSFKTELSRLNQEGI